MSVDDESSGTFSREVKIKIESALNAAHDEAEQAGQSVGAMVASHVAHTIAYVGEAIVLAIRERRF